MQNQSFLIMFILYMAVMGVVSFYIYRLRKTIDEMHGMMIGMTFGMIGGLVAATLFLIPTGNFLDGVIIGSLVGLLLGIPFGNLGGHLGIMEGAIAGPMGGMMGAMLGQMVRPFNIEIFIPFLSIIFLIIMGGLVYAVNCRASCCEVDEKGIKKKSKIPKEIGYALGFAVFLLVLGSFWLSFPLDNESSLINTQNSNNLQVDSKEAIVNGNYQEIELQITATRYSPSTIIAKKGIPLRINLNADSNAGCTREILFPDFGIDKIVPAGGKETIEINPTEKGEFKFRCSMDMAKGVLIVK